MVPVTLILPPPSAIRHPPSAIHPFQVRLEDYLREGSAGDLARALELEGLCGANADDPQARLGLGTWEFVTNCVANLDTAHIDHTVDLVEYSRDAFVRAQTSAHYFGTVLAICPPNPTCMPPAHSTWAALVFSSAILIPCWSTVCHPDAYPPCSLLLSVSGPGRAALSRPRDPSGVPDS